MKKILLLALVVLSITSCKKSDEPSNLDLKFDKTTLTFDDVALHSKQLKIVEPAQYVSDPRLEWLSSDKAVAVVDQKGNVTAVGIGQTIVYAYIKGLNAVRAECTVTVLGKGYSLKMTAEQTTLTAGDTIKGSFAYSPAMPAESEVVVWQTDTVNGRPIVKTVIDLDKEGNQLNSVKFIGVSPGKVRVKFINSLSTMLVDSLEFTVNGVEITDFQFADAPTSIEMGTKDTIQVAFTPQGAAYNTVTWKSSDPYYASVDAKGVVTANKLTGTNPVTIYASTADNRIIATKINIVPNISKNSFKLEADTITASISYEPILSGISYQGVKPTVTLDASFVPKEAVDQIFVGFIDGAPMGMKTFLVSLSPNYTSIGQARFIVTQGEKDKNGKLIADSCVVIVNNIEANIVEIRPVYNTTDLGATTIVSAKFANLYSENMVLDKAVLMIKDAKKPNDASLTKVIETLTPNLTCPANVGSIKVDFKPLETKAADIARYIVQYTFTCPTTGLTNVIAMPVKLDNGASFVKKR